MSVPEATDTPVEEVLDAASHGRRRLIVGALLLSSFIVALESTVTSAVMPIVVSDIGGVALYTWAFNIFLLAGTAAIPLYGRLADGSGRKPLFLVSMGFFLVGSLGCGLARSMLVLILFRAVQGLGGAGLTPVGATMLADVTTAAERPRYMGYVSGVFGVAAIAGPIVGAWLVGAFGWPFVFWMGVPIGLASVAIVIPCFNDGHHFERPKRLGLFSAAVLMSGIAALTFGLLEVDRLGWPIAGAIVLLAAVVMAAMIWRDRNSEGALIPVYLWRLRILAIANASALLCGAIMMGVTVFLPIYVMGVLGGGPLAAGTALGIMSVSWTLASLALGRVMQQLRYRPVAWGASVVVLAGAAMLLAATVMGNEGLVLAACAVLGVGLGGHSLVFTIAAQSRVTSRDRARSTSMFYFLRRMGQTIGAAALGGLFNFALLSAKLDYRTVEDLMQPKRVSSNSSAEFASMVTGLNGALSIVFVTIFLISLLTFAIVLAIPPKLAISDTQSV